MNLQQMAFQPRQGLRWVKRLAANHGGRDFVIGDLHGCREYLDRLLHRVEFDPSVDRLISVGDLVDRGPNSLDCLRLLEAPWFHVVMGNHEQMLLDFFAPWLADGSPADPYAESSLGFLVNGGHWALFEIDSTRRPIRPLSDLLPLVSALPQVIVVGDGKERYHVVHAELVKARDAKGAPGVWSDAEIDALDEFGTDDEDYPAFRWSRRIMGNTQRSHLWPTIIPELSMTFCGHTVGQGIRRAFSHVCLDTGAFVAVRDPAQAEDYGLTLIDVKERRWFTAHALHLTEGEL